MVFATFSEDEHMSSRSIAKPAWSTELAAFSEQHEGWLVSIRRYSPDGETVVEAHDVPLEGISSTSHEQRHRGGDRS